MIAQLTPADFPAWRHSATADHSLPVVLDVREPWELQTASVRADGFTLLHIPMRDVPAQLAELQQAHGPDQPIACLCHHGMRSLQVATYLAQNGFTQVVNLQGGIDAWSQQVDPSVPAY
jgi:rhodanese-related sulfurtransferase